jgi:GntR family transcriptional regulator
VTESIGPSYQLVADDIRSKISSGQYAVNSPIPSTSQLMKQHRVSSTVVRQAVERLKAEGLLIGHSGKAVFVRARPDDAARQRHDIRAVDEQMTRLRDEVRELAQRVDALERGELRDAVGRVEVNLIDLFGKLGFDYPRDESTGDSEGTAAGERGRLA